MQAADITHDLTHDLTYMAFAEVKKFRFGADIQASDGVAGRLECVVADPARRTLTAAGIRPHLFGKTHFVPLHLVAAGTAQVVTLTIPLAELEQRLTTAEGTILSGATRVAAARSGLGRLTQLTIHGETQALRHLVVARPGREVLAPAPTIDEITARQITINLGSLSPGQLTAYRDDAELRQEALDAIYDYWPLRVDMPGFEVHAIDGVIWLRGHVASDLNRRLVADQLVGIPGLAEVHNDLIADTDLAAAVSMALAHDPRTAGERLGVYPRLGVLSLRGNVRSAALRQAAFQVAAAVPSVKEIVNELRINPQEPGLPDLAAVTNQEDMVPGGT